MEFDTSQVLFIVGGAFVGIENLVENRLRKRSGIGFGAKVIGDNERAELHQQITVDDVVEFGIIPELMGRLPLLGILDTLTESDMYHVMTRVKNSVLEQCTELLAMDDIELVFSDQYVHDAAEISLQKKLGARAIKSIVESSTISLMYRAKELRESGVVRVVFDKYPDSQYSPTLISEDGSEQLDTEYFLF